MRVFLCCMAFVLVIAQLIKWAPLLAAAVLLWLCACAWETKP